mmetsp:Transcript_12322/g.36872  ORF Transcript_12322/g.36872 Transcript_12322/m.36872 type:complete len:223 (-) Transcript_12322:43-711(-)
MSSTEPANSVQPPVRRRTRSSKAEKTVHLGWWITAAMVTPFFAKARSAWRSSTEDVASSPEVGSSRKSRAGSAQSSMPQLTRFFCPPETPRRRSSPTTVSLTWSRPSISRTRPTKASRSSLETLLGKRMCAAKRKCSWTVSTGSMMSAWGTKPTRPRSLPMEAGTPSGTPVSSTAPVVLSTLPERMFMMVDLPAPEAPIMAVMRPARSSPVAEAMICLDPTR